MLTETVLAVSVVAPLLLLVLVLIKCLGCLRKQDGFKNFENEDSRMEARINPGFAMGQDTEETDAPPLSTTAIQIEPLPELLSETTSRKPKITCVEKSRQESALKLVVVNNPYPFPRRQLKYLNEIGSGWFGQVLESDAEHITTGIPLSRVVVKVLKDDASNSEKKLFLEDVLPYRELEHDNVLRLLAQCTESTPYLMILEYAPMGDLKACAKKQKDKGNTDNYQLVKFAKDAASGLACLHRHGYIHQDFAARNCVVMADYKVKVGDYGISEDIYSSDYFDTGNEMLPVRWMAPESLSHQSGVWQTAVVTREANIWSFGVLLWEMLNYGEKPYTNMSDTQVLQSVVEDRLVKLPEPSLVIQHRDRIFEVMQFCWLNPGQRPSIEDAHGLLQQLINISSGAEQKQDNFEKKWNQTIPSEARVVSAKPTKQTRRPPSASFESDFSPVPKVEPEKQISSPGFDEMTSVKVESSLSTSVINMPSDVSDNVAHLQTPFQPKMAGMMTSTPVMDPAPAKPDESDIMKKSNTSGSKTSRKIEEDFEKVSVLVEKSPDHDVEKKVQAISVPEKTEDPSLGLGSEEIKSESPADPFQDILADVKSSLPTDLAALQDLPEVKDEPVVESLQNGLGLDSQIDHKNEKDVMSSDLFNTPSKNEMLKESTENLNAAPCVDLIDRGNTDLLGQGNLDLGSKNKIDLGGQGDFISKSEHALDFSESSSDNKTDSSAKCDMQSAVPDSTKMAADLGKQTSFDITAETGSSQQPTVQSSNVDFLELSRSSPNSLDRITDNLVSSTFQQVESLPSEIDVPQETDEPDSKTGDTKTTDVIIENGSSGYETHSVDQSKSESNDANSTLGTDSSSDSAVCVSSPELADAASSFEGSAPPGEKVGTCIEYLSDDESKSSCSDSNSSTDSTNSGRSYECQERNPNIQVTDLDASDDSYDTDDDHDNRYSYETTDSDEDMDLRIASELYLSKGVSLPQVFERPPLETIPEDVMPSPSDTSSVDLKFDTHFEDVFASQDNFEWDDFMGESIVGRDRTGVSPKASFDMSDWMMEGDSMSFRSNSSAHSPGGSLGSDVTGASDSHLPSTPSVSEVKRVRGRTPRSYVSDLITNRSINPSFTNTKNTRTPFYSLYDTLELDGDSDGGRTSPDSNSLPESHPSESVAVELHDNEEQITLASQPDDSLYIQTDTHQQPKGPAEILEEADATNQIQLGESNMAANSSAIAADRGSTDSGQGQSVSVTESAPTDLNSAFEKLASQHNIGLEMFGSNEESADGDEYNDFGFENFGKSKDIDLFDDFPGSDETEKSEMPSVASFFTGVDIPVVSASSNKKVSSEAPESEELEIEGNVSQQEPPVAGESFKLEIVEHQTQSPEEENTEPEIQPLKSVESPSFESPNKTLNLSPEPTEALENQNAAEGSNSISQSIEILKPEDSLVESKDEVIAHSVDDSFPFSVPSNLPEIEAKSFENNSSMSEVEVSTQGADFDVPESCIKESPISSDSVLQTVPSVDQDSESFTLLTSSDSKDHAPTTPNANGSSEVLDQITEDASIQLQSSNTRKSLPVFETMEPSEAGGSKPEFDEGIQGLSSDDPSILKDIEKVQDSLPVVEAEEEESPASFPSDQEVQSQEPDSTVDILGKESPSTVPDNDVFQDVAVETISQSTNDVLTSESSSIEKLSETPIVETKDTPRTFSMTEPNKVLNMFDNILYSEDAEPPTTPSELKDGFVLGGTTHSLGSNQSRDAVSSVEADEQERNSDTLETTDVIDSMDGEHIDTLDFLGASPESNPWTQQTSDDETADVSESSRDSIKDEYIPPSLDLFRPPNELTHPRQTGSEQTSDSMDNSLMSTEDPNQLPVPVTECSIEPEEMGSILLSQPLVESSLLQPLDKPFKAESRPESSVWDETTCVSSESELVTSPEQFGASESTTDNDFDVPEFLGGHGQKLEFIDQQNIHSSEIDKTTEFVSLSDAVTTESNDLQMKPEPEQDNLVVSDSNSEFDKTDDSLLDLTKVDDKMSGFTDESFSLISEEPSSNIHANPFDQFSVEQLSGTDDSSVSHALDGLGVSKASSENLLETSDQHNTNTTDFDIFSSLQTSQQTSDPSPGQEWNTLTTSADLVDNNQSELEQTLDKESMIKASETPSHSSQVSECEPLATPSDLVDKDEPELDETLGSGSFLTLSETPTDPSPVPDWEPLTTPSKPGTGQTVKEQEKEDTIDQNTEAKEQPSGSSSVQEWEHLTASSEPVDKSLIIAEQDKDETIAQDTEAEETQSSPSSVTDWEPISSEHADKDPTKEEQEPELKQSNNSVELSSLQAEDEPSDLTEDLKPFPTTSDPLDKKLTSEEQEPEIELANVSPNAESLLQPAEQTSGPSPVPDWEPITISPEQDTEQQEPEPDEAHISVNTETLVQPAVESTGPSPVPEWEPITSSSEQDMEHQEPKFEKANNSLNTDTLLKPTGEPTGPSPVPEWEPLTTSSGQDTEQQEPDMNEAHISVNTETLLQPTGERTGPSPVPEWEPITTSSGQDTEQQEPDMNEAHISVNTETLLQPAEEPTGPSPVPEWEPITTSFGQDTEQQEPELDEAHVSVNTETLLQPAEEPTGPSPVPGWEPITTSSGQDTEQQKPEFDEAHVSVSTETLLQPAEEPTGPSPVPEWEPITTSSGQDTKQQEPDMNEAHISVNTETLLQPAEEPTGPSPVPEWEPITTSFGQDTEQQEPELDEAHISVNTETLLQPAEEPTGPSPVPGWEPITTSSGQDTEQQEPELDEAHISVNTETLLQPAEEPTGPSPVPEWEPITTSSGQDTEQQEPELDEAHVSVSTETLLQPAEEPTGPSPVPEWEPITTSFGQDTEQQEPELDEAHISVNTETLLQPAEEPTGPSPVPEWEPITTSSGQDTEQQKPELEEASNSLNTETLHQPDKEPIVPPPVSVWEPITASSDLLSEEQVTQTLNPSETEMVNDFSTTDSVYKGDRTDVPDSEMSEKTEPPDSIFDDFVKVGPEVSFVDRSDSEENANTRIVSQNTTYGKETKTSGSGSSDENSFLMVDEQQVKESPSNESFGDVSDGFKDTDNQSIDFPDSSMTDSQESAVFLDLSDNEKSQTNSAEGGELVLGDTTVSDVSRKGSILDSEVPESEQKTSSAGGLLEFDPTIHPDDYESKDEQSLSAEGFHDLNADDEAKLMEVPRRDSLLDLDVAETAQTENFSDFESIQRKGSILDSDIPESNEEISPGGLLDLDAGVQDTEIERKSSLLDLEDTEPQGKTSPSTGGLLEFESEVKRKGSVQDTDVPRKGSLLDLDVPEPHGNTSAPSGVSDIESMQRKGSILDSNIPETDEKPLVGGLLDFDSGVQGLDNTVVQRKGSTLDLDESEPAPAEGLLDIENKNQATDLVHDVAVPRKDSILDFDVPEPQGSIFAPEISEFKSVERKGSLLDFDIPGANVDTSAGGSEGSVVQRKDSLLDLDVPETNQTTLTSVEGLLDFDSGVQRKDSLLDSDIPETQLSHTGGEQLDSLMTPVDNSLLPVESDPFGRGQNDVKTEQTIMSDNLQTEVDLFGIGDVHPDQTQTSSNVQSSVQEDDPFGGTDVELVQTLTSKISPQSQTQTDPFDVFGTNVEHVQTETSGNSVQSQLNVGPFGIDGSDSQVAQSQTSDSNLLFDFLASESSQNQGQTPESSDPSQDMFGGLLDLSPSAPVDIQTQAGEQSQLLDIFGSQDTSAGNQPSKEGDLATSSVDLL